jgi:2-polyprenyl-3-methyl-5-hydroxy-6-metoxy-1,4-benzoquinol methylase
MILNCQVCEDTKNLCFLSTTRKLQKSINRLFICSNCLAIHNESAYNLLDSKNQIEIQTVDYVAQIEVNPNNEKSINEYCSMYSELENIFNINLTGTKALDFGCGIGYSSLALSSRYSEIYSVDFTTKGIEYLLKNYNNGNANIFTSNEIDKRYKYDLIYCWHVFEHLATPKKFISDLYDLLSDNGLLLLQTPLLRDEYVIDEHFIFYAEKSYQELAKPHSKYCKSIIDEKNGFITTLISKKL